MAWKLEVLIYPKELSLWDVLIFFGGRKPPTLLLARRIEFPETCGTHVSKRNSRVRARIERKRDSAAPIRIYPHSGGHPRNAPGIVFWGRCPQPPAKGRWPLEPLCFCGSFFYEALYECFVVQQWGPFSPLLQSLCVSYVFTHGPLEPICFCCFFFYETPDECFVGQQWGLGNL